MRDQWQSESTGLLILCAALALPLTMGAEINTYGLGLVKGITVQEKAKFLNSTLLSQFLSGERNPSHLIICETNSHQVSVGYVASLKRTFWILQSCWSSTKLQN